MLELGGSISLPPTITPVGAGLVVKGLWGLAIS
jgi:hypothetical protein